MSDSIAGNLSGHLWAGRDQWEFVADDIRSGRVVL
jgi:hypothetical protein